MLSIIYFAEDSTEVLDKTVKQHADVYSIPYATITAAALPTLLESISTPYVMLAKPNTYLHLKNILALLAAEKNVQCFVQHYDKEKKTVDFDCGFLVKTAILKGLIPSGNLDTFSEEFVRHLSAQPGFQLNLRPGFNKLNFEGSYAKTHHCELCIGSFQSGMVFTLGNMSDSDMIRYHTILENERNGKGVTMAIALMIKDEEEKIEETMSYYKNPAYFPEIYILDTGSTDKTLERVKAWQQTHPATRVIVTESPFVDFSSTRNLLLDQIYRESKCDYIMSTDCNDEMRGQDDCFKALQQYAHFPVIFIDQIWKGPKSDPITFSNIRIVKNNGLYRWRYRVHEVLMNINDSVSEPTTPPLIVKLPPSVHLYQFRDDEYETVKSARYHRDLKFFLEDYALNPTDKRIVYYLAQTYFFTQDYANAIVYCKKRILLNKPEDKDEEVYHSLMRICRCKLFLQQPTYNIKKWLWRAWDYYPVGKKDIEPLFFIANFYEQENDVETAFHLYSLCLDTTRPQHNLPVRNDLYTIERHKKLAELYYKKRQYDKIYPAYARVLTEGTPEQRQSIETLVERYYPSWHFPTRPVVVIYGGMFYDRYWNGKMFFEKTIALGGSETMVIRVAHLIAEMKRYNVVVFTNTEHELVYNDVTYLKVERYQDFMTINTVQHLIVSRDASKALERPNRVAKTYLWLHDLTHVGDLRDEKCYDKVITLTPFHRNFYENTVLEKNAQRLAFSKKGVVIPNFIRVPAGSTKDFQKAIRAGKDNPHRFIYSSCPTRGLEQVVNDWPAILERFPKAELWLYCDFNNEYVRQRVPHLAHFLMKIERIPSIRMIGRLPEEEFIEHCKKAAIWYYPTDFQETFCITAVQMMANGVIPLYRSTGAIPNLIEDSGLVVDGQHSVIDRLVELESAERRASLIKKGIERARQYSDTNVKKSWEKLLS